MVHFILPHFGPIDPNALESYYETEIPFNSQQIQIDLNFGTTTINPERLKLVKHFIENIRIHDIQNKGYIKDDFNNEGDNVPFYIEHHLEELGTDEIEELIGTHAKAADQPKLLMNQLHLKRVGIYPEGEDWFAIFDYTLGIDLTDMLIVIYTDENGNLDYMTTES